jgi:hypothetical protein
VNGVNGVTWRRKERRNMEERKAKEGHGDSVKEVARSTSACVNNGYDHKS